MTTETITTEKIVERIEARRKGDMSVYEWLEYLFALEWKDAAPFLGPNARGEEWPVTASRVTASRDPERWRGKIREYLPFAFEKANNQRGGSAYRSTRHFIAWTWLAGDVEFSDWIDREFNQNYQHYGKEILRVIAEKYGVDWKELDDGRLTNKELDDGRLINGRLTNGDDE